MKRTIGDIPKESNLIIIPAIDLKGGKCVRLLQGDFSRATVYSDNPAEVARIWQEKGAERIHVVDLDGSLAGVPRNKEVIREIILETNVPVQVGGGIRDMKTLDDYLEVGVYRVILGTAAMKDRKFVIDACKANEGKVILGIDASGGKVAVEAWTEGMTESALEVAKSYEGYGLDAIVYTDIERDGMEVGVNIEATRNLASSLDISVIASGGVSNIHDIEKLLEIERFGVVGVIIGKALYSGALRLEDAIERCKRSE
jgi:phosphoribosylformimino-5-aminoimidazole carboxamide ribotide isomerase